MWKEAIKKKNLKPKKKAEEDDEDEADPEFSEAFQREELGPPEVSDEALERFDERATKKEINRLVAMGVLQEVTTSSNEDPDLPEVQEQEYIWLTTKFVYDWRFREVGSKKRWMRRARLVAREYKVLEKRDDIFSPATTPALTRLIPCVAMMRRWCVYAADIKDAFLQVPQKRKVLCAMDEKTREQRMRSSCASWRLLYVLPGQRDGRVRLRILLSYARGSELRAFSNLYYIVFQTSSHTFLFEVCVHALAVHVCAVKFCWLESL